MQTRSYKSKDTRYDELVNTAIALAETDYRALTREALAARSKTSRALINHYLGSRDDLRECIVSEAVKRGRTRFIANYLAATMGLDIEIAAAVAKTIIRKANNETNQ